MDRLKSLSSRLPRWGVIVLVIATLLVGLLIVAAPLISRTVLIVVLVAGSLVAGLLDLITARSGRPFPLAGGPAAVWFAVAILIAVWPGHSLRALAVLVGIGLLASGIAALIDGLRRDESRIPAILLGVAGIVAGFAAFGWSSVSILGVAAIFGVVLILRGVATILRPEPGVVRPTRAKGLLVTGIAVVALLLAAGATGAAGWIRVTEPTVPEFYLTPDDVTAEPGVLLRSEPYEHEQIPEGARAWRILYTTMRNDTTPSVASGLVVVPTGGTGEPVPVIAWSHGTTGYAEKCAPSILSGSFETGAMFVVGDVIEQGWAMVATDYPGLGSEGPHPYLVGQPAGRSVLDAVRAAQQLEGIDLSETTVVWGHSQGGHGALWTGIEATAGYAPEVDVIAVAALAAASNLPGLASNLETLSLGPLFASYMLAGYAATYPDLDIDDYLEPGARIVLDEMAGRCLAERGEIVSVLSTFLIGGSIWKQDPGTGPLGDLLIANVPSGPIDVPMLLAQGAADQLVIPAAQEAFVAERCAGGDTIEYREYAGLDHLPLVEANSPLIPDLIQWTQDRFDGAPAPSNCNASGS